MCGPIGKSVRVNVEPAALRADQVFILEPDPGLADILPHLSPGLVGIEWSQKLARQEGIFTGISGGATFAAAMQVAGKAAPGSVILCMLPDTGERYLSSPLFEGVAEGMTDEETELSLSTPGFHMPAA